MFACLQLSNLPLEAILRFQPESRHQPCAVIDPQARRTDAAAPLLALNPAAAEHRLHPGLPATLALARCPALLLLSRQPAAEERARQDAIDATLALTPEVELSSPDSLTFHAPPAARPSPVEWLQLTLQSLARLGLPARLALADHPDLARLAARHPPAAACLSFHGPEPCLQTPQCPVPTAPQHLAPLPLDLATPDFLPPALLPTLQLWGIHSCGQLAQLPTDQLQSRLGPDIKPLLALLHPQKPRPLLFIKKSKIISQTIEIEYPIENQTALEFYFNRMIHSIVSSMSEAGRVAACLKLELGLEDGARLRRDFRLPEPSGSAEDLLRPLRTFLESLRLPARVRRVAIEVEPLLPGASERGLFDRALRHPHRFADTLARLESMLGPDAVGVPVPADSHRPDDFELRPFVVSAGEREASPLAGAVSGPVSDIRRAALPLRRCRPPIPLAVAADAGPLPRPLALLSGPFRGDVAQARGPFPMSGHWWDPAEAWQRVEWDLELAAGHLVRVAFLPPAGWQLEGSYD